MLQLRPGYSGVSSPRFAKINREGGCAALELQRVIFE